MVKTHHILRCIFFETVDYSCVHCVTSFLSVRPHFCIFMCIFCPFLNASLPALTMTLNQSRCAQTVPISALLIWWQSFSALDEPMRGWRRFALPKLPFTSALVLFPHLHQCPLGLQAHVRADGFGISTTCLEAPHVYCMGGTEKVVSIKKVILSYTDSVFISKR